MGMYNFRELKIWQRLMYFTVEIYKLSEKFPIEEKFGLSSQVRRSAVSISSNIAEGAGRNSNAQFQHFL